jgi:hypothetical protein
LCGGWPTTATSVSLEMTLHYEVLSDPTTNKLKKQMMPYPEKKESKIKN